MLLDETPFTDIIQPACHRLLLFLLGAGKDTRASYIAEVGLNNSLHLFYQQQLFQGHQLAS